jgi:Domain of unknown function (DUF6134)
MVSAARSLAAFVLVAATGTAASAAPPPDPFPLYGKEIEFTVWREGSQIGHHRVTFVRENGGLIVRSLLDIAVRFLGIVVYRYHYASQETWRDGRLMALASTIDDNGKPHEVEAKAKDGKLAVTAPDLREVIAGPILPSTHWDAQVIGADRVLNTLNGKVDDIKLAPLGVETVPTGAGPRAAMHYRYIGAIKAESWYDAAGHWVKLRFPGTDGSTIDYVCQHCLAAP